MVVSATPILAIWGWFADRAWGARQPPLAKMGLA
jgi:hypothetical protein